MLLNQNDRAIHGAYGTARKESTGKHHDDRRGSERQQTRLGAFLIFRNGAEQMACQIIDMSPKGARLRVADSSTLPKFFELHTPDGEAFLCELKRRKPDHVGVEFLQSA